MGGELSLSHLISAPMEAAVDADFAVSRKFVEFLEKYGFEEGGVSRVAQESAAGRPDGGHRQIGKLRMLSFDLPAERTDPRYEVTPRKVEVPLLSLIPLPLLQLQSAEFEFSVRIHDEMSEEKRTVKLNPDAAGEDDAGATKWRASFVASSPVSADSNSTGSSSRQASSRSVDANLHARISIRQADLPVGISRLLAYMNENVRCHPETRSRLVSLGLGSEQSQPFAAGRRHRVTIVAKVLKPGFDVQGAALLLSWPEDSKLALYHLGESYAKGQRIPVDKTESEIRLEIESGEAETAKLSALFADPQNTIIGDETFEIQFKTPEA